MGLDNPLHIAFLLIVLLLVFGARRLPELGRSLGAGMRGFRDALGGETAGTSGSDHPAQLAEPAPTAGLATGAANPSAREPAAIDTAVPPMDVAA
jgi:sec-independent protein translocase protein TatA